MKQKKGVLEKENETQTAGHKIMDSNTSRPLLAHAVCQEFIDKELTGTRIQEFVDEELTVEKIKKERWGSDGSRNPRSHR